MQVSHKQDNLNETESSKRLNESNIQSNFTAERHQTRAHNNGKLEYGKSIKLMKNGDEFHQGQKVVINSRKYRYLDTLLDDLSNILNARFGAVRSIYTPVHGHRVTSLDNIEDGATYVAGGVGKFVKLNYLDISEGRKAIAPRLPALTKFQPAFNFSGKLMDKSGNVVVNIYKNGDVLSPPTKILLHKNTLASFDAVLNEITTKISLQNGAVVKLYSMYGDQIASSDQLVSGQSYVAANRERFKKCEYFAPEDFGISPRLLRKANNLNATIYLNGDDPMPRKVKKQSYVDSNSRFRVHSQPPSTSSMPIQPSGKGNDKPYLGWRPTSDEVNHSKTTSLNKRKPLPPVGSKPVDFDKDESGVYKAKKNNRFEFAVEVPDNEHMVIDLPVELQDAIEVDDEDTKKKSVPKQNTKLQKPNQFMKYESPVLTQPKKQADERYEYQESPDYVSKKPPRVAPVAQKPPKPTKKPQSPPPPPSQPQQQQARRRSPSPVKKQKKQKSPSPIPSPIEPQPEQVETDEEDRQSRKKEKKSSKNQLIHVTYDPEEKEVRASPTFFQNYDNNNPTYPFPKKHRRKSIHPEMMYSSTGNDNLSVYYNYNKQAQRRSNSKMVKRRDSKQIPLVVINNQELPNKRPIMHKRKARAALNKPDEDQEQQEKENETYREEESHVNHDEDDGNHYHAVKSNHQDDNDYNNETVDEPQHQHAGYDDNDNTKVNDESMYRDQNNDETVVNDEQPEEEHRNKTPDSSDSNAKHKKSVNFHDAAVTIQAAYKGFKQRKDYSDIKNNSKNNSRLDNTNISSEVDAILADCLSAISKINISKTPMDNIPSTDTTDTYKWYMDSSIGYFIALKRL